MRLLLTAWLNTKADLNENGQFMKAVFGECSSRSYFGAPNLVIERIIENYPLAYNTTLKRQAVF